MLWDCSSLYLWLYNSRFFINKMEDIYNKGYLDMSAFWKLVMWKYLFPVFTHSTSRSETCLFPGNFLSALIHSYCGSLLLDLASFSFSSLEQAFSTSHTVILSSVYTRSTPCPCQHFSLSISPPGLSSSLHYTENNFLYSHLDISARFHS